MTAQYKRLWQTILTVSLGLILGVGVFTWMSQQPQAPEPQAQTDSHDDQRFAKLEQVVMILSQLVQNN
jgi:hypothetical protein